MNATVVKTHGWHRRHTVGTPLPPQAFTLLCLTIAAVLALHAGHLPWWLTVMLATILAGRWWQHRRRLGRSSLWIRLPLTILLPAVVIATWGTIFGRTPGTALAIGLLVLKTLESERIRDVHVAIAFAFFTLMCALLFGQSLMLTIAVMLGLLPALACLRALQPAPPSTRWLRQFRPVVKALLLAIPMALAAFLFLPRLSSPLWGAANDTGIAQTGISDSMSPGNLTQLLIDDSPAFRVTFNGPIPPPDERYFRGPVLWWFDGRTWRGNRAKYHHTSTAPAEPIRATAPVYSYTVTMQPSHRHWLFALDTPLSAPRDAHLTHARTLVRHKPVDALLRYHVRSAPHHVLEPVLSARERRMGLELPAGFDPRARALAHSWRHRYGDNNLAIVNAALRMFHNDGFRYTLRPPPLGRNSIDDFLFQTKAGFCEHYASSFTFLMRAAGIPARVVTGYQGGYWSPDGHYLLVRQSDAHAWGEVWLKGRGWVRFDPTAAVSPDRVTLGAMAADGASANWYQQGWVKDLRNRWDLVNHLWNESVLGFNALRQRGLLTPFGIRHTSVIMLVAALATSIFIVMLIGMAGALRPRRHGAELETSMTRLKRRLARAGVADRPGEGPRQFFARAAAQLPRERKSLQALGTAWIGARYARPHPTPASIQAFCRAVRHFHPRRPSRPNGHARP